MWSNPVLGDALDGGIMDDFAHIDATLKVVSRPTLQRHRTTSVQTRLGPSPGREPAP